MAPGPDLDPAALTRRGLLAATAALAVAPAHAAADGARFHAEDFATVGSFDVDWLDAPEYVRLLDAIAASPGAIRGVRVFGALNSGARERVFPEGSGTVWPAPDAPVDLSPTLRALDALVERGLVPFLPLAFFPRAVSPSPIVPPADFVAWGRLVRAFLDAIVARYGAAAVAGWWFEVWNEPNMPPFWGGDFARYLALYRATSAAVRESGHRVRLGGPVVAYVEGADGLVERFLAFLAAEPEAQCDFVSIHRKGIWGPHEAEPVLSRSVAAAQATADAVLRLVPGRAQGMWIVNDEADMKVGFDTPYEPRMTEQFPSYLAAQAIEYAGLTTQHAAHGMRFAAASDNANQHLVQAPFDGRRSLMTPLSARRESLVKLPVWHFYELLRVLGPRLAEPPAEDAGLHRLVTEGEDRVAALFTLYATPEPRIVEAVLRAPWKRVNVVVLGIDAGSSNAYAVTGRRMGEAPPAGDAAMVRQAAELASARRSDLALPGGVLRHRLPLGPYSTALVWITPYRPETPATPRWLPPMVEGGDIILRWMPNKEADFYGYELLRRTGGGSAQLIAPRGLRGAIWVDTAPPSGTHTYGVRAVSTSGVTSETIWSPAVTP